jgi:hypothetical protein
VLVAASLVAGITDAQSFVSSSEPVRLIELYASEGSSSCPAAEAWLRKFRERDGLWSRAVPIAFHVTYWDRLGWPDPFAQQTFTVRQRQYSAAWGSRSIYTPGFVVDGDEWRGWFDGQPLPPQVDDDVGVLTVMVDKSGAVDVDFVAAGMPEQGLRLHIALLGHDIVSNVRRGENAGRQLAHEFVALGLETGKMLATGKSWHGDVAAKRHPRAPGTGRLGYGRSSGGVTHTGRWRVAGRIDMGGTSDIEALDRQVKDRGYCIIEDVIPADVVAGISADVLAVDPMHNRADAPYADVLAHLTSIWMLTDFTEQNGATLIVPNSHRQNNNPTGNNGVDPMAPHLEEIPDHWRCRDRDGYGQPCLACDADERARMVDEIEGAKDNQVPAVEAAVFADLPADVKPLFGHWTKKNSPPSSNYSAGKPQESNLVDPGDPRDSIK